MLTSIWRKPREARISLAGRKPWDVVIMFNALVLSALYNLSDDQIEFQIRDRLSFMRFLGLGLEDRVPDAKTVWLFWERLTGAARLTIESTLIAITSTDSPGHRPSKTGQGMWRCGIPRPRRRNQTALATDTFKIGGIR